MFLMDKLDGSRLHLGCRYAQLEALILCFPRGIVEYRFTKRWVECSVRVVEPIINIYFWLDLNVDALGAIVTAVKAAEVPSKKLVAVV